MILRNKRLEYGPSRKAHRRLQIIAALLAVATVALALVLLFGSTSDTALNDVLLERARLEEASARTAAGQLSRIGGVGSLQQLSQVRQHLYGLTQLNLLAASLSTVAIAPQQTIDEAMAAVDACETRILSSQTIEMELEAIWASLSDIAEAIAGQG